MSEPTPEWMAEHDQLADKYQEALFGWLERATNEAEASEVPPDMHVSAASTAATFLLTNIVASGAKTLGCSYEAGLGTMLAACTDGFTQAVSALQETVQ